MNSPEATRRYLALQLAGHPHEVFGVLLLDTQHRLIRNEEMFRGTIDSTSVHPRVVVQRALQLNAAALIVYHNHPSGLAEPSAADRHITERLVESLALIDVRIIDHLVVAGTATVSFAERGWL
jgi:DNA repair protein RadC